MRFATLLLLFSVVATPVQAQKSGVGYYGKAIAEPGRPLDTSAIKIDQRLGEQVPLDLVFRDEHDKEITLGSCVAGKPTILVLAYYHCPQMCTLVINDTLEALKKIKGDVGDQFNVVVVSFDPKDLPATAYENKEKFLKGYDRAGAEKGLHFLCGHEQEIKELCDAVGFRYEYDKVRKQYNHASGITVITPYGKISKYIFGIGYEPSEVQTALEAAGAGKIGKEVEPSKIAILLCYERDPATGEYTLSVMKGLRVIFGALVLGLGFWLVRVWRRPPKNVSLATNETQSPGSLVS